MCGECNWKPVYIDPKEPLNDPIIDEKTGEGYWPRKYVSKEEALKMFPNAIGVKFSGKVWCGKEWPEPPKDE